MRTISAMFTITGLIFVSTLFADENQLEWNPIKGDVVWLETADSRMRDTCLTNVFYSLTANGYVMANLSERVTKNEIAWQSVSFPFEGDNRTRFSIDYLTMSVPSFDGIPSGQVALMHIVNTILRSSIPPWYEQYMEGPGNICLVNFRADVSQPLREVFFCRDNVAVHIRSFFGDDCLAFAKLLDGCILASSVEKDVDVPNAIEKRMPEKTLPTVTPKSVTEKNRASTENKTIKLQISTTERETPLKDTTTSSCRWLYVVIGILLIFCVCTTAYLMRKKKQGVK